VTAAPLRVLIVDDSAVVRKLLADGLAGQPDITVVGTAADPFIARDLMLQHRPDVLTLDIEMPRLDGLSFLAKVMEHQPMPVIVISSITKVGSVASVEALRLGAIDVIAKPGGPSSVGEVTAQLLRRLRQLRQAPIRFGAPPAAAARIAPTASVRPAARPAAGLIVIGASTGGTRAIETLLTSLPAQVPPILIAQHMPAGFTRAFAARLDTICPMHVREAEGGELLQPGTAYVAPGDHHLVVERAGLQLRAGLRQGPPVHFQRPAVDVLFHSVARLQGLPTVALLLTGMGADGAEGLLALKEAGAETIAQDEHSCVVFGMPREAILLGAARQVLTLVQMPTAVLEHLARVSPRKAAAS
jgi:two-component system chemotaxis response regulator CheB